jgi:hypothetical protein
MAGLGRGGRMAQNRPMAAETIIFYEMPLWERGGLVAMGLAVLAIGYAIWRTPRDIYELAKTKIRNHPAILPKLRIWLSFAPARKNFFFAGIAAILGIFSILMGAMGETVALEPEGLRCGGHGLLRLDAYRDARPVSYADLPWMFSSQNRTGLALVPPAGYSTICREFDYLDEASRARLLALVRERIAARPRN